MLHAPMGKHSTQTLYDYDAIHNRGKGETDPTHTATQLANRSDQTDCGALIHQSIYLMP